MFCPADRDWLLSDTYPDEEGRRALFLCHAPTGNIVTIGDYKKIESKSDCSQLSEAVAGMEAVVLQRFTKERYAYSRSGLHCDLHPRWKRDGTSACFDSIHEGTRQMYKVDTGAIMDSSAK